MKIARDKHLRRITEALPELYRRVLPPFFKKGIPEETAATCSDCAMLRNRKSAGQGETFFAERSKCCTHYPVLPNYLAGALLSSTDQAHEEGRYRIRQKIRKRIGITPLGIMRPGKYTLILKNTVQEFFGRSSSLVCPFFESGKGVCTVYPFWDAVCGTWFCKYERGQEGKAFWLSLRKYMENAEKILGQYALYKMDMDAEAVNGRSEGPGLLTVYEADEHPPDREAYTAMWGKRTGSEEAFYIETYRTISKLTPKEFGRIEGVYQKILLRDLEKKHNMLMAPVLPERLIRNPQLIVHRTDDDSYAITGYSPLDPLLVTRKTYDMLDFFDGRLSNKEVCKTVKRNLQTDIDDDLLQYLYQFRILIDRQ
ncbi:MAG: hypothetical protein HZB61_12890 [Nitrospirae bacterium]|nr:hypothetical protein [Nitrospirota bacterium]